MNYDMDSSSLEVGSSSSSSSSDHRRWSQMNADRDCDKQSHDCQSSLQRTIHAAPRILLKMHAGRRGRETVVCLCVIVSNAT